MIILHKEVTSAFIGLQRGGCAWSSKPSLQSPKEKPKPALPRRLPGKRRQQQ